MINPINSIEFEEQEFYRITWVKHEVGETWVFEKLTYVAYHDGVCLHVLKNDSSIMYRFMDIMEEQKSIIDNFMQYVNVLS